MSKPKPTIEQEIAAIIKPYRKVLDCVDELIAARGSTDWDRAFSKLLRAHKELKGAA